MSDPFQAQYREWFALVSLTGLGNRTLFKLIEQFEFQPLALLRASPAQLQSFNLPDQCLAQLKAWQQGTWPDAESLNSLDHWLLETENHLITFGDERYPTLLKQISDPPLLLYLQGDPEILHLPQLAIVGSRSASNSGLSLSSKFASSLTEAGLVITSGLALGVDGAAHSAAVELNKPTIAVLGSGLNNLYPRRHKALARAIIDCGGALLSELPLNAAPLPYHFPRRNRIISGLSAGVLVVEASQRSGSLITARQALEQGREVFALPGALNNPQSHGCHTLIREGAQLVETTAHIVEQLGSLLGSYQQEEVQTRADSIRLSDDEAWLLDQIGFQLISLEELVIKTDLNISELMPRLITMELNNYIEKTADGYLRLI